MARLRKQPRRALLRQLWIAAALACLMALPALGADRLFRVGIVTGQLPRGDTESFLPFTRYLSEHIAGARFEVVPFATIEALIEAARQGSVEFALCTPAALVAIDVRHGVRPIATVTQSVAGRGAFPWLAGAVFVRGDRTMLRTLADARGQRVVALSPLAVGGWLAALGEWRRLGLDERTAFKSLRFEFSYERIVAEVCAGDADVGVVAAGVLASLSSRCARPLRVLPAPAGPDTRYPAAVSTRLYPEAAFAVLGAVDERLVSDVTRELLAIETDSPAARAATVAGFTAPLSYTPVHELLQELHVGPYESFGRVTLLQALSQHAGTVLAALLGFVTVLSAALLQALRLNTRLKASMIERNRAEDMRRRLEEHTQHAQRMDSIGRLAGAVAHDFNNMLTVINGYSELLLLECEEGSTWALKRSAQQILNTGRRAAELTQQLLTFSRKQAVQLSPTNLNTIVREAETMFRHLLGEEIDVILSLSEDLWLVLADRTQIHQVLLNLLVNARDAMRGRGTLRLETGNAEVSDEATLRAAGIKSGPYAWLEVADTGVGMDRETLQRIFEPFFSTKGQYGTGLGLATVYGIVKQAQGGILVFSTPAAGSRFRVLLPRTQAATPDPGASTRGTGTRGGHCVLVIEDQDDVRAFAHDVLEAHGYEVLQAESGTAALAIARGRAEPIDLILADVVLRDLNGREATERILELHPESRVLFTSGYPDDEIARRGVSHGNVAFLPKPYTAVLLMAKVAEILTETRA